MVMVMVISSAQRDNGAVACRKLIERYKTLEGRHENSKEKTQNEREREREIISIVLGAPGDDEDNERYLFNHPCGLCSSNPYVPIRIPAKRRSKRDSK